MTKSEFLDALYSRLAGLPQSEIDDVMADYAQHFADGMA
ncbi:HAAS signaling domain-containing protein, partial [Pseudomonas aeruginosa]